MRNYILFDDHSWDQLLPLTFTRPTSELRVGTLRIRQKWERYLDAKCSHITQDYLSKKFPVSISEQNILINGGLIPNEALIKLISQLEENEALIHDEDLVAANLSKTQFDQLINDEELDELTGFDLKNTPVLRIRNSWDLLKFNGVELKNDFRLLTEDRESKPISNTNIVIGKGQVFLEEGVIMEACTLNTTEGDIYIGKNAMVMEGSLLRGPLSIGDYSVVKMGSKIYGKTSIGPVCKVGGEINASIMIAFSNKGHDGYMGDSIIGEWCNIGADTNISNLKNNYTEVKIWSYPDQKFVKTGRQFLGLIMGDHSKAAINTMFNTGTVVGVSCNIYGEGFPRNYIPSFSWGGKQGFKIYKLEKALETMRLVKKRRNLEVDEIEENIYSHIFDSTTPVRHS